MLDVRAADTQRVTQQIASTVTTEDDDALAVHVLKLR